MLSNPKMAPILTCSLSQTHIKTTVFSEIGFSRFPVGFKKNFLCLMLKHQFGNVESWLESWSCHFTNSHTPRLRTKHVLFYLVKCQNCCFEWSNLKPFSLAGARSMARMAQFAPEIYLRTWKTHHEKLYNKCSNL